VRPAGDRGGDPDPGHKHAGKDRGECATTATLTPPGLLDQRLDVTPG
jgi:hypothetical protein